MSTRSIAVFVAAVGLVTVSPVMAQSSDLLSSAERLALTTEVEQDQSVIRRRRSGGLAWIGGSLAVAGIVLALRPPVCELVGEPSLTIEASPTIMWTETFTATSRDGMCGVLRERDNGLTINSLDVQWQDSDFRGRRAEPNKTLNYAGWATAAAGGVLMWYGLRSVDVPVRFDVAPTGGFRVSRSLGW